MKFSIIIPVYNIALHLRECLDSVLAQSFTSWEAICVDDGSSDGSGAILDEYSAKDHRFSVIHKENRGVGAARNNGLNNADGNLIMFLDGDDMLRDCALADIADAMNEHPRCDFVVFNDVKFKGGALPIWTNDTEIESEEADLSSSVPAWLANICVWGAAYRKEVVKGLCFRDCVLGEDLVFFCEVLARAKRCSFLGRAEYANRLRQGSASRSAETYRKIYDRIIYHNFMFKTISDSGKEFGRTFTHGRGNSWIEEIPSLILSWPDKNERASLFLFWMESMHAAAAMTFFSRWQRFVATLVSATRSRLVARLFCVLPYKLKVSGFHR